MSNWHSRTGDRDANTINIIYHIPVPNVNNRVSVNYRTALLASGLGGTTVMTEGASAGQIDPAEKTQIEAGELYEYQEVMFTNPGENLATIQARIDARYTELVTQVQAQLQNQLSTFGHDRDVP